VNRLDPPDGGSAKLRSLPVGCHICLKTRVFHSHGNNLRTRNTKFDLPQIFSNGDAIRVTKYVETKIIEIEDADFQTLIGELCESVCMTDEGVEKLTLANLFSAFVTGKKVMNLQQLPTERILSKKVKELKLGSVVHDVCCELALAKGKPMDNLAGTTVFALIKQCYKAVNPPLPRLERPTRLHKTHQFETTLINRRRGNGSYF
jgi:hypothetical protein